MKYQRLDFEIIASLTTTDWRN